MEREGEAFTLRRGVQVLRAGPKSPDFETGGVLTLLLFSTGRKNWSVKFQVKTGVSTPDTAEILISAKSTL